MQFPETTSSRPTRTCPLQGILGNVNWTIPEGDNYYRRYGGALVSTCHVDSGVDVERKGITYRVGPRSGVRDLSALDQNVDPTDLMRIPIRLNENLIGTLNSCVRRQYNTNIDYDFADLTGLIARLGAALGLYALRGSLTCGDIRGGKPLQMRALNTMVNALPTAGHVFIPQQATFESAPAAFTALVCACAGEGAVVLSDVVQINPANNAAQIVQYVDAELAEGVVAALRILFNMYDDSNMSAVAAYAFTVGIHRVGTVTGHTDEGGYIRDVLRRDWFATPFGGIYVGDVSEYVSFPTMQTGYKAGAIAIYDSAMLVSAGCSALADPLVQLGESDAWYPTLFGHPGAGDSTNIAANRSLRTKIAGGSFRWANEYARLLGQYILGSETGAEHAARALRSQLASAAIPERVNTHLAHEVVAPYYWIEPTTLFMSRDEGRATSRGYGVIAGTLEANRTAAYPKGRVHSSTGLRDYIECEMRSLRTVPAFLHMFMSRRGSEAHVVPWQFREDRMAMHGYGRGERRSETPAGQKRLAHEGVDQYSWDHGQAMLPSPAECMYLGVKVGIRIQTATWDDDEMDGAPTSAVPAVGIGGATEIQFLAKQPELRGTVRGHADTTKSRRERRMAERQLIACGQSMLSRVSPSPNMMVCADCEPGEHTVDMDDPPASAHAPVDKIDNDPPPAKPAPGQGPAQTRVFLDKPGAGVPQVGRKEVAGGRKMPVEEAEPVNPPVGVGQAPKPVEPAVVDEATQALFAAAGHSVPELTPTKVSVPQNVKRPAATRSDRGHDDGVGRA